MNAWCFALPTVPLSTIHPLNPVPSVHFWFQSSCEGLLNNCWLTFFLGGERKISSSWGPYCHDVGILIYFIQTQLNQITLAWLCMPNVICFSSSLPCIINKWHLDFIKVPRPLWQYNVTGGHFNMSHKRLGWYYLRQPVAPQEEEEEEERCHDSSYCCLEGCVMQEP